MGGPSANSPLEKLLHVALKKAGIGFTTQERMLDRYCVDIMINQAHVIIEADGALHYLRLEDDKRRDAELLDHGYRVFRFHGKEINNDPDGCVRQVVEQCGLVPDEEPVFIIRNGMVGHNNPNWVGGPQEATCTWCGSTTIKRSKRYIEGGTNMFCDSQCYGKWMRGRSDNNRKLKHIDWLDVTEAYYGGMSFNDMTARYGCSAQTIRRELARQGVKLTRDRRRPNADS